MLSLDGSNQTCRDLYVSSWTSEFRPKVLLEIRPSATEYFRGQDAKLCAQLSHANIVPSLDLGQHDGFWFIANEYEDGICIENVLHLCQTQNVKLQS